MISLKNPIIGEIWKLKTHEVYLKILRVKNHYTITDDDYIEFKYVNCTDKNRHLASLINIIKYCNFAYKNEDEKNIADIIK